MLITLCTKTDFDRIIADMGDFWGEEKADRLRMLHNPMLFHEFGTTAYVAREGEIIVGYLFGLYSQTSPTAYVKFVGVRQSFRKRGVGRALYEYFTRNARKQGCGELKAITSAGNLASIAFHRSLGMSLEGEPDEKGIPVVRNYGGPGMDRVVFRMRIR